MRIAIIQYSTYGHITALSEAFKKSIDATGLATKVDILQVPETLSEEVLTTSHAPPKPAFPIARPETLIEYDAFLFGYPTSSGDLPTQLIDFWDATAALWAKGELAGKTAGIFVSTSSQTGGQEVCIRDSLTLLAHHRILFIPLGHVPALGELTSLEEPHRGSPCGAGAFAGYAGSSQPSKLELEIAAAQGTDFVKSAIKFYKARALPGSLSFPSQPFQSLRHSFSSTSIQTGSTGTAGGGPRTRLIQAYVVQDIYGDMDEQDIKLQRTATKQSILTILSNRVQNIDPRYALADDESKLDKDEEKVQQSLYQDIPDVSVPAKDFGGEFCGIDPELVSWDGPDDPDYPRNWSRKHKIFQTMIISVYTLISPLSSSILSPALNEIGEDLNMKTPFIKSLSVTIMILAWAIGPLIIAPISESDRFGRRPVLNVSIWIIFVFNLACGFAKTSTQLIVFRFLGGLGGCAPLNVGAGTLADLYSDDERLVAMAAYSISPSLGPVLSPVISSFIITSKSWRWVFYVLAIFNGAVAILGTIFFRETYSPRLLKIKANMLRKETGNTHLHTIYEIADGETSWGKLYVTISRPIKLLTTHPMVIGLGSFMAFVYGFMYLMIVTFPDVFGGTYGFSVGISGLMYVPMGIGFFLGTIFWTWAILKIFKILEARNGGVPKPEYRLPCLCFSGIGIPVGLIWYGWSVEMKLHWIMPSIGSAIFAFSFIAVFQTIQNYLIDMNNRFAASAVAAATVFRSLFGFAFPLFAHSMYDKLHYGWGNTMCGLIALTLGLPFPIFCFFYGERLRNWANRRMDKEQAMRDARNLKRLQAKA